MMMHQHQQKQQMGQEAAMGGAPLEARQAEVGAREPTVDEMLRKMGVGEDDGGNREGGGTLAEQWAHEMKAQGRQEEVGVTGAEGGITAEQRERAAAEWADELRESDVWSDVYGEGATDMSRALEEVLNGDPELSETKLRDFIAAINEGQVTFENGSIVDHSGNLFDPSTGEDALSARPYVFKEVNPYMSRNNCFQSGVDALMQGNVVEAINAFEAEVQKEPENSDAWLSLGLAHAENDEDVKAIIALNRAVQVSAKMRAWNDADRSALLSAKNDVHPICMFGVLCFA